MAVLAKLKDAIGAPVLVRFRQSVATFVGDVFTCGEAYWLAPSIAAEMIRCGNAAAITEPDDTAFAKGEIRKRECMT